MSHLKQKTLASIFRVEERFMVFLFVVYLTTFFQRHELDSIPYVITVSNELGKMWNKSAMTCSNELS
jgi:hypothetical protein